MNILWFTDPGSTDLSQVGGKGANLGRLTQSGFVVPPGFVVGTAAYSAHIEGNQGLRKSIASALGKVNYEDPNQLEACVSEIRSKIIAASISQNVGSDIEKAYKKLGADTYVAVRSSGTAEDLEGASFAGLHDTYLDILGVENVLDAVKRCWASMWTARAVSYRQAQGFDHFKTSIAVVVQTMVESEVSGVMFTVNPINTATDEILINANWGLGESVVSGIVTPDEYIVKNPVNTYRDFSDTSNYPEFKPRTIVTDTRFIYTANPKGALNLDEPRPSLRSHNLKVLRKTLETKDVKIVRDPKKGNGTIHLPTTESERAEFTLSDEQVIQLAELGRRIQEAYESFPQDIEWAYQGGQFYVLQARPITGVDFSWDAEVTASVQGNGLEEEDTIFSRNFPEEMFTGVVSPLMFSWRVWGLNTTWSVIYHVHGFPELDYDRMQPWIYYKGLPYYNAATDREMIKLQIPPQFREAYLEKIPPSWREEVKNAPFDWLRYISMHLRTELVAPHMGLNWWRAMKDRYILNKERNAEHTRIPPEQLKFLSDNELKQRIWELIVEEAASYDPPTAGLCYTMREILNWVGWMVANWYVGDRPQQELMTDLLTGTRNPIVSQEDSFAVWELADMVYKSNELSSLCEKYPDERFLVECEKTEEGREFLTKFAKVTKPLYDGRGHRGHADRCISYDRFADNPMLIIQKIKIFKGTEDPRIHESKARAILEETIEHVIESTAKNEPFGAIKAEIFKVAIDVLHHHMEYRDNERAYMDRSTYMIKRGFMEVNRRIMERQPGVFDTDRDFYFLTMNELYDVLDGKANIKLTKAKIAARKRNCEKALDNPPYYVQNGKGIDLEESEMQGGNVIAGKIVSGGKVTAKACVAKTLDDLVKLQKGDILVVNATDPGWASAFMIVGGIISETGGLVSHTALLAREYKLPALQLRRALNLIPDGATITLDCDAGKVIIHDNGQEPDQLNEAV